MEYTVSHLRQSLNFMNPRWAVFSRILAAIFGGYIFATIFSMLITQLLTYVVGHYQAIHFGLILTFLIYAFTAMWVFSVSRARKAWLGLLKVCFIASGFTWVLMQVNN